MTFTPRVRSIEQQRLISFFMNWCKTSGYDVVYAAARGCMPPPRFNGFEPDVVATSESVIVVGVVDPDPTTGAEGIWRLLAWQPDGCLREVHVACSAAREITSQEEAMRRVLELRGVIVHVF